MILVWIREAFGVNTRDADDRDLKLLPDGARMPIASGSHLLLVWKMAPLEAVTPLNDDGDQSG